MARGRGKSGGRQSGGRPRRREQVLALDALPEVYQEMLADAIPSSPTRTSDEGRTVKKRRVGGRVVSLGQVVASDNAAGTASDTAGDTDPEKKQGPVAKILQQTAYNDSEDSADSDLAWEEVDLRDSVKAESPAEDGKDDDGGLDLVLNVEDSKAQKLVGQRRKPASAADRKMRLEIHKMHLLTLLVHVHLRNDWCNDEKGQAALHKLLSKRIISYLDPDEKQSQFQKSRSFMDGLNQVSELFKNNFHINARGMSKPYWAEDAKGLAEFNLPNDVDLPAQRSDFRETASKLKASRDIGAQLFCALLRSTGVEARLVCSLQLLSFASTTKGTTPQKPRMLVMADLGNMTGTSGDESAADTGSDTSIRTAASIGSTGIPTQIRSRLATRLGRELPTTDNSPASTPQPPNKPRRKRIRESPYPVYWVEAFNHAVQKWVPVDPLVTNTVAKPSRFEPPASDPENNMTYVIAFEEGGTAKDVTKRYAKAYNAKTRRGRVESTKGGERWLCRVMRYYKRAYDLDRDQVEDAELAAKEASEEMPRNVQDFKDHPYYALERHLKRSEVIYPRKEVGKVSTGKSLSDNGKTLEPIYRKRDVHLVKSADSWYRLGREIKAGEQPLKRVQARRRAERVSEDETSEMVENAGTAMYAAFQTVAYQAPPVVNGRIPKNVYGNLDIYVPSMVPPGGVHISHPETAKAAKILGIDYSDAVTGFEFKGRQGTAVIKGAVIAIDFQEAIEEVIRGFEDERVQAEEIRRSLEALRMWKRLLAGLRIRERIDGYDVEGERDAVREEMDVVDEEIDDDEMGGGFLPDANEESIPEPTVERLGRRYVVDDDEEMGGFERENNIDDQNQPYQSPAESTTFQEHGISAIDYVGSGGGFTAGDDDGREDEDAEEALRAAEQESSETHMRDKTIRLTHSMESNSIPAELQGQSESGGGFLIEESENEIVKNSTPISHPHQSLAAGELEEALMPQRLHESGDQPSLNDSGNHNSNPSPKILEQPLTPPKKNVENSGSRTPDQTVEVENALQPQAPSDAAEMETTMPEENEDDKGSLLSEDPSDEDADPEWLV